MCTAVEQRRLQQPGALSVIAKALGSEVEVPLAVSQSELISGCRRIRWRCVDRRVQRCRAAVLDRLQRVDAGRQRYAETDRVELHRDGAVQLERADGVRKAAARAQFHRAANWFQEPVEHT